MMPLIIVIVSFQIHRILLNSVADVEFVTLVSPSCIWVRLLNNVAGQLDYLKPYPINQALEYNESNEPIVESLKAYEYYMAPRSLEIADGYSDVVYSRARLLAKEIVKKHGKPSVKCYMHYIDHGYGAWMKGVSIFLYLFDCMHDDFIGLFGQNAEEVVFHSLAGHSSCFDGGISVY